MPFVSKAQQRFAFATNQPWAKEFADKTNFKGLPEKVSTKGHRRGTSMGNQVPKSQIPRKRPRSKK